MATEASRLRRLKSTAISCPRGRIHSFTVTSWTGVVDGATAIGLRGRSGRFVPFRRMERLDPERAHVEIVDADRAQVRATHAQPAHGEAPDGQRADGERSDGEGAE